MPSRTDARRIDDFKENGIRSTLDLFAQRYVLLSVDQAWIELGGRMPVDAVLIGRDFRFPEDQSFASTFGVLDTGATLVRPDGIVAWRSQVSPDAEGEACIRHLIAAKL